MSHYTGAVPDSEPAGQWVKRGACKDDADAMFPGTVPAEIENAKAICRGCPVVQECGQWALDNRIADGVWGGMSEADRRNLHRRQTRGKGRGAKPEQEKEPRPPRKPAECGTRAGYHKHYREKTPYCTPCRAANTAAQQRRTTTGTSRVAV